MRIEYKVNNLYLEDDFRITSLPEKAKRLFEIQTGISENNEYRWELASIGYESLKQVQIKKFDFGNYSIEAHFNKGRITSSSAKVDNQSIIERPCFLCVKNLPLEQKVIKAINKFNILVNPFPIFPEHYTISSINHEPQTIKNEFKNFLLLSKELGENYSLFYNGPKCGASAPDHLHFQAGTKGFMKIDNEYEKIIELYGNLINGKNNLKIYSVTGYLRNFISLESGDINNLINAFNSIYLLLQNNAETEPMLNIICYFNNGWKVIIFPRSKHRPSHFFEEGDNNILISPASVDLGGNFIFPREKDFEKVTKDLIIDICIQVTISDENLKEISDKLKHI